MSDWLNENAFNDNNSNDDFLNSIFDQNQGEQPMSAPPPAQQQAPPPPQQQQQQQQQAPVPAPPPLAPTMQQPPAQMYQQSLPVNAQQMPQQMQQQMQQQQQQQRPPQQLKQEQLFRMKQQLYQQQIQQQMMKKQQENLSNHASPMNSLVPTPQQGTPTIQNAKQPPQPHPQAQAQHNNAKLQSMQIELFLSVLYDFLQRSGVQIQQPLLVNGKRVNLFIIYVLSQKMGGYRMMKAFLLMSPEQQRMQQQNPWTLIALKMGFYEGVDDQMTRERIDREICNCYTSYILPYEEYYATPGGNKDIEASKHRFQQQIVQKYLSNAPTPAPVQQSPMMSSAPTPHQQRKLSRASNSVHNSPNVNSPYQTTPRQSQAQIPTPGPAPTSAPAPATALAPAPAPAPAPGPVPAPVPPPVVTPAPPVKKEVTKEDAQILKNYIPFKKVLDTHGPYNIKELSQIASEIEVTKPVYLFAPELGIINLQALTMSIKSNSGLQSAEVVNALNTLLVATSDVNYAFQIRDCMELLDALSVLGKDTLNKIMGVKRQEEFVNSDVTKLSSTGRIDDVFSRYVKGQGEDILYVVNSLTGEVVSDEDEDMDEIFSITHEPVQNGESPVDAEVEDEVDVSNFHLDDYLTALQNFKQENKHHFSKIQTRSAMDDQIMLVDQLVTITMILRNISFAEYNKELLASNRLFKDLLFSIVKNIALNNDKFVYSRKRLCLLKDCLLMLDNIALYTHLHTLEEAFLSFVLVASFGPKIEDKYKIPRCNLDTYSYFSFGIDAFTKLMVREPYNRSLIQAVLNGTLNASLTGFSVSLQDQEHTRKLIKTYSPDYKSATLLTRAFQMYMSILPFDGNTFELSKFIFTRSPTISQMLFGAKLLIDMVPVDDLNTHHNKLSLYWLLENREVVLGNFARSVVALSTETGKFPRESPEHKILSLVLRRALVVINSLVNNAVLAKDIEEQRDTDLMDRLTDCLAFPRIIPDSVLTLDTFLAPTIDTSLGKEVVRLLRYLKDLKACEGI
ncbi:SWI/SNF chromatin-remodeling complex subunit SWI1 [Candida viswanathii]|uniref:SWI/SNF chromatin-remodeling complex subunit SWI1 n=1 Tax=Candida viswanathii TaxID=5486 RepID=A0A367Y295_9ASCO|nr:SWI/SNF chromatin-remodeling complex subunit SWI1 [Candida viswanathii]